MTRGFSRARGRSGPGRPLDGVGMQPLAADRRSKRGDVVRPSRVKATRASTPPPAGQERGLPRLPRPEAAVVRHGKSRICKIKNIDGCRIGAISGTTDERLSMNTKRGPSAGAQGQSATLGGRHLFRRLKRADHLLVGAERRSSSACDVAWICSCVLECGAWRRRPVVQTEVVRPHLHRRRVHATKSFRPRHQDG